MPRIANPPLTAGARSESVFSSCLTELKGVFHARSGRSVSLPLATDLQAKLVLPLFPYRSYPALSYSAPLDFVLFCIMSCPITSFLVMSVIFRTVLSCPVLFSSDALRPVTFCPVPSFSAQSRPVLSTRPCPIGRSPVSPGLSTSHRVRTRSHRGARRSAVRLFGAPPRRFRRRRAASSVTRRRRAGVPPSVSVTTARPGPAPTRRHLSGSFPTPPGTFRHFRHVPGRSGPFPTPPGTFWPIPDTSWDVPPPTLQARPVMF